MNDISLDQETSVKEETGPDTFHDRDRLLGLALKLGTISWLFLILAGISLLGAVLGGAYLFSPFMDNKSGFDISSGIIVGVFGPMGSALIFVTLFFLLRAFGEVIFLLMDIEDTIREQVKRL